MPIASFNFNFNLRRYTKAGADRETKDGCIVKSTDILYNEIFLNALSIAAPATVGQCRLNLSGPQVWVGVSGFGRGSDWGGFGRIPGPQIWNPLTQPQVDPRLTQG